MKGGFYLYLFTMHFDTLISSTACVLNHLDLLRDYLHMPSAPLHDEKDSIDLHMNEDRYEQADNSKVSPLQDHVEPIGESKDRVLPPVSIVVCINCVFVAEPTNVRYWQEVKEGDENCQGHQLAVVFLIQHLKLPREI